MLSNIANRIFPSEANALRPRLACEITSAGVVAAGRARPNRKLSRPSLPCVPACSPPG
jgi:hypothetical protein